MHGLKIGQGYLQFALDRILEQSNMLYNIQTLCSYHHSILVNNEPTIRTCPTYQDDSQSME